MFEEILQTWGKPKTSVHVVLRDNAKNMIKAMNDAGLPSLACVAHTLQLAVHEAAEPPAKLFLKAQASTSSSLDTVFEEIAKEQPQAAQPLAAGAAIELDTYLGEAPSPREDSPLKYWGVNKIRFPTLAKMAHKYLSAPCSSVESERLFSSVSHIIDENRNRLTADNAEKLLFIKKKNLPLTFSK